ncbi:MAG: nicotinate phosphoribosyltransferase [Christensenellales bacterium]|jgi:nicotinate phosphoribosyltransferase
MSNLTTRNLSMMTDLYQFTMMYGYYKNGMADTQAVFDLFFRLPVGNSSYAVMAGLEQAVEYIQAIRFEEEDLSYLRTLNLFDEDFLVYLAQMRFSGELYAIPEGTVVFPHEPLLRVKAPIIEAQFIETALLNIINHQTLIATKASRVVHAAQGGGILEFGLRRAQGPDAGNYGARAAMIGGCVGTSNVMAAQMFDVPAKGTHAHSWVMSFESELSAFRAYAEIYPDNCLLLVDTYDTINSGIPNAITVFKELRAKGYHPTGIRLDSGDLAYLSKRAREMLDEAGFTEAKIFASSDLDENLIKDLKSQGACIDVWGVGTKLITSDQYSSLGGVYKMSAMSEAGGEILPKIKLSENITKTTNPGYKKVVRFYSKKSRKALADLIMLDDETVDETKPLTIFSPTETWKKTTLTNFYTRDLLQPVFLDGRLVYDLPDLQSIQAHAAHDMDTFWEEYKRITNPQIYKVDLSDKLFELRRSFMTNTNQI